MKRALGSLTASDVDSVRIFGGSAETLYKLTTTQFSKTLRVT